MKTILLSESELELLKNILEKDIKDQENELIDLDDVRFEMWLMETRDILNKVNEALK